MSSQPSDLPTFQSSDPLFDEAFLRRLERLAILSRRALAGQLQGERRSPKRGQSVEFADFRPYAPGDDFRRIDWNAYARLERFFIKLFVEEEDLTVHLLIDASRSMDWGQPNKLQYAVRAAGALGYVALVGLDRVTVTALGMEDGQNGKMGYFAPRRGKGQAMALFAFLQSLVAAGHVDLAARLQAYAAKSLRPGPLLLFSDLFDTTPPPSNLPTLQPSNLPTLQPSNLPVFHPSNLLSSLNTLASRGFEITVLHILAPDEVNPDASTWLGAGSSSDLKLLDIETGAEVEITADYDLLQRYRNGLAVWQEELRRFFSARGMHYVPVETSLPFEELLFTMLRRRGVLK